MSLSQPHASTSNTGVGFLSSSPGTSLSLPNPPGVGGDGGALSNKGAEMVNVGGGGMMGTGPAIGLIGMKPKVELGGMVHPSNVMMVPGGMRPAMMGPGKGPWMGPGGFPGPGGPGLMDGSMLPPGPGMLRFPPRGGPPPRYPHHPGMPMMQRGFPPHGLPHPRFFPPGDMPPHPYFMGRGQHMLSEEEFHELQSRRKRYRSRSRSPTSSISRSRSRSRSRSWSRSRSRSRSPRRRRHEHRRRHHRSSRDDKGSSSSRSRRDKSKSKDNDGENDGGPIAQDSEGRDTVHHSNNEAGHGKQQSLPNDGEEGIELELNEGHLDAIEEVNEENGNNAQGDNEALQNSKEPAVDLHDHKHGKSSHRERSSSRHRRRTSSRHRSRERERERERDGDKGRSKEKRESHYKDTEQRESSRVEDHNTTSSSAAVPTELAVESAAVRSDNVDAEVLRGRRRRDSDDHSHRRRRRSDD